MNQTKDGHLGEINMFPFTAYFEKYSDIYFSIYIPSLILGTNDCHATNRIENTTEFPHKN